MTKIFKVPHDECGWIRKRVGLDLVQVEQIVLQPHNASELFLTDVAHDDPIMNRELVIQEEAWVR